MCAAIVRVVGTIQAEVLYISTLPELRKKKLGHCQALLSALAGYFRSKSVGKLVIASSEDMVRQCMQRDEAQSATASSGCQAC